MKSVLLVVGVLLNCLWCSSIQSIAIKDGDELMKALCNINGSMNLTLNSSVSYTVSLNMSCVVNGSYSVVIESKVGIANVTCINQNISSPVPNIGIGFFGMESVSMSQINVNGCGTKLKNLEGSYLNHSIASTHLFFMSNHSALFVFVDSNVSFYNVNISQYYGFAIIGINLVSTNFTKLCIYNSLSAPVSSLTSISIGSGVLIVYVNSSVKSLLTVHNSTFNLNFGYQLNRDCIIPYHTVSKIHFAAALTLLSYDVSKKVLVTISKTSFAHNIGAHAGALLIDLVNASSTVVVINQSTEFKFNNNGINCPGSALAFYMYNMVQKKMNGKISSIVPLQVVNTSFIKQDGMINAYPNFKLFRFGAIYAAVKDVYSNINVTLNFSQIFFHRNEANHYASCLFVEISRFFTLTNVVLKDLKVTENKQTSFYSSSMSGLFTFINVYNVHITGSNKFFSNFGSVIKSYSSHIYLDGYSEFFDNNALSGAAFNIEDGHLYFGRELKLSLQRNSANHLGGAIYAYFTSFDANPSCALQFESVNSTLNVTSENNIAVNGGNVIFAFPAYNCHLKELFVTSVDFYIKQFNLTANSDKSVNEMSSAVHRLVVCKHILTHRYKSPANHYPGETIKIPVCAVDEVDNYTYSQVHVRLVKIPHFMQHQSKILTSEEFQIVKGNLPCSKCSNIDITVLYLDSPSGYHHLWAFLYPIGGNSDNTAVQVPLNITKCPLGFSLAYTGACQCSEAVQRLYKFHSFIRHCDIDYQTIPKPTYIVSPWFGGIVESINETVFALAYHCPLEFCVSSLDHHSFHFDTSTSSFFLVRNATAVSHKKPICRGNRKGIVCGGCTDGHSVVFGTSECKKCSNWWLWTVVFYVTAGPLLICFLYFLRLTVTAGTLNGIIFFAQTANVGILETITYFEDYSPRLGQFLSAFLSLLNLNLGFPLCLYNEMNEYVKTGLSLVFPVYLLIFPAFCIVVSRYSSWLSNRRAFLLVQVFITVVHLSLSKLIRTTIDVFTPISVYVDKSDVPNLMWYRNGNEKFDFHNSSLVVLMAISIIVSSVFLIPYLVLLVGGKCMIKSSFGNKYFRSTYESIHSPYKDNRKYWFVVRFFLLMSLYLIFAIMRGYGVFFMYLVSFPLLMVFLIFQMYLWPFKSKLVNILDSTVVLVLVMLYMTVSYTMFDLNPVSVKRCMVVLTIFVFFVFVLFVFVIIHHIMLVTSCYHRIIAAWKITRRSVVNPQMESPMRSLLSSNASHSNYYESFGEPVLDHK